MSGNDSTPKADGGQGHEAGQGRYRGQDDDGAAVVRLAEALTRQLQAIAASNNAPQNGLSQQQVRLTTHYGALTNMLGNFGRHGTPRVGILSPPPELVRNTRLTFAAPIPGAATVATFDAAGGLLERKAFQANGVTVKNGDLIDTVEIENGQGNAFLFGFVTRPADVIG
jgi:hypothetical protein